MNFSRHLLLLFVLFYTNGIVYSQLNPDASAEKWRKKSVSLIQQPVIPALQPAGVKSGYLKLRERTYTDDLFSSTLEIETRDITANYYDVQLRSKTIKRIEPGEIVLIRLFVRASAATHESGEGSLSIGFQQAKAPYETVVSAPFNVKVGKEWREIIVRKAVADKPVPGIGKGFPDGLAAGEAQVCLSLGFQKQTIEIAGLEVLKLKAGTDISKLPKTRLEYPGSEPDAAWRSEADERIEKYRKQNLAIKVVDEEGRVVPGAKVHIAQQMHDFKFGTAIDAATMKLHIPEDPWGSKYREMVFKLFNSAGPENDLKWLDWEKNARDHSAVMQTLEWCRQSQIAVRGHVLMWPVWKFLPKDLPGLIGDTAKYRQRIFEHIRDIVTATKGYISEWDVINEANRDNGTEKACTPELMADIFRFVKSIHPDASLVLNEQGTLSPSVYLDFLIKTAKELKERNAPFDAVGLQCHYGDIGTPPQQIIHSLNRLAEIGKRIQITEFDVNTGDEDFQAAYLSDFYTAVFSHPSVDKIQMWGFWAGKHWKPAAALYRTDWSEKPAGAAYRKLVFEKWWTDLKTNTDEAGRCSTRGFKGVYLISASKGTLKGEQAIRLTGNSQEITLVLKKSAQ